MPDADRFREVMGLFATGVAVVTSLGPHGEPCGLTANAVASVSLDPLLLLVCLDRRASTRDAIVESRVFAVNILKNADQSLAHRFAFGNRDQRFEGLGYTAMETGAPVLGNGLAWLDCRVHSVHEAGDHSVIVGQVASCGRGDGDHGTDPLIFFRGGFGLLDEAAS